MKNKLFLVAFWLCYTLPTYAQITYPENPDDGDDPREASVDQWMILLIMIAIFTAVYFIKKRKLNTKNI